jgi:hypothetical protein
MLNSTLSDKRREGEAASVGVLSERGVGSLRLWWSVWRWPAALLVGFVLWLALVTVAGAAASPGRGCEAAPAPPTFAVERR